MKKVNISLNNLKNTFLVNYFLKTRPDKPSTASRAVGKERDSGP